MRSKPNHQSNDRLETGDRVIFDMTGAHRQAAIIKKFRGPALRKCPTCPEYFPDDQFSVHREQCYSELLCRPKPAPSDTKGQRPAPSTMPIAKRILLCRRIQARIDRRIQKRDLTQTGLLASVHCLESHIYHLRAANTPEATAIANSACAFLSSPQIRPYVTGTSSIPLPLRRPTKPKFTKAPKKKVPTKRVWLVRVPGSYGSSQ